MANKLQVKRSSVPGKVPTTTDLDLGEIAINTYDGKVYMKKNVSGVETIVLLTGAGAGDVLGPASSADNAIARFDGTGGKTIQNSSASIDDSGNLFSTTQQASGTGANIMPVGTTAQRPTGEIGMYRMNSTTGEPEWWEPVQGVWIPFHQSLNYTVEYALIAGGAGGGKGSASARGAGGGGAGGMIVSSVTINAGQSYSVIIGAGGAGGTSGYGGDGSASEFGAITTVGGGAGAPGGGGNGNPGGSGGGAGDAASSYSGGAGTSGQGNNGGGSASSGSNGGSGGAGGGKVTAGTSASGSTTGVTAGGAGLVLGWIDSIEYATGGNGGARSGGTGASASANTGGGGGGGGGGSGANGGSGGSGKLIIRYLGAQRGSGGTVSSSGGYTYHTFNSSGTFVA